MQTLMPTESPTEHADRILRAAEEVLPGTTISPVMSPARRRRLPSIDMFTPDQVCRELAIDDRRLLELVNQGHLPAYRFGDQVRFRIADVATLIALLTLG